MLARSKAVCHCAHGPGGAAAPLLDARGAPVSAAQLSRNAQALWALCQAPGGACDDSEGVLVAVPGLPRAPPPQLNASGEPALQVRRAMRVAAPRCANAVTQAVSAAARERVAAAEHAVRVAQAAVERADRVPAPRQVAAPPPPAAPPAVSPLAWEAGDTFFSPLDDDLLLGGDDLGMPGLPLQPAPPLRRLLQWSEVGSMVGAILEVFWEAPPGGTPPTGWYVARVLKMSQRGQTQLHYQQTNATETMEAAYLQNLVKRGLVAILQMPPAGQDDSGKRKR